LFGLVDVGVFYFGMKLFRRRRFCQSTISLLVN
jgi:hypothetical protein